MPKAITPEWDFNIQDEVHTTARPDFLLPSWDRRAELNSFGDNTKHPGSKPGFNHRQVELGQRVARQIIIQPETRETNIEGIGAVDSPLMAAAFFSVLGSSEWGKKHGSRLLAIALVLAGCIGVSRQESTPTPKVPPAVVFATNTPDAGPSLTATERPSATHIATLAATLTETPFFGAGGAELPGGLPDQIRSLLETGMNLPITDCVVSPETGGNQEEWNDWINTLVKNRASRAAIVDLEAKINVKLVSQGTGYSTRTLELCSGGGGGWSFVIRDKSSGLFWWSFDVENNRYADRPDRVFEDRDWNFRPMPRKGLKSGLEVEIMMVNGWPLAVAVNPEGRPIQHFDPVLAEFINFYPETPTPTRTASATRTATNTPRPTAIPATAIPATAIPKPSPIPPEPSPTALSSLPCDQRGGPENECLTHLCVTRDYTESLYGNEPLLYRKGLNMWAVEWYARAILADAAGAVVIGDCP